jgi:hypothetical protein
VAFEIEIASGQSLATEGRTGHTLVAVESGTADVVIDGATVRSLTPAAMAASVTDQPSSRTRRTNSRRLFGQVRALA